MRLVALVEVVVVVVVVVVRVRGGAISQLPLARREV
jgi:hypothetical protein